MSCRMKNPSLTALPVVDDWMRTTSQWLGLAAMFLPVALLVGTAVGRCVVARLS